MPFFALLIIILLLAAGGIGYCMRPSQDTLRKARFKPFEKYYFAHRGLHDDRYDTPENTIAAFRRAISYGYGVTVDVRLTKDKQLVALGRDNMLPLCGVNIPVHSATYDELHIHTLKDTNERVPLLSKVLDEVAGRVPVIIELPPELDYEELCRLTAQLLDSYEGAVCVQSLSADIVTWFRQNRSDILRGQMAVDMFDARNASSDNLPVKIVKTLMLTNYKSQPDFVSYDFIAFDSVVMKIMRKVFGVETAGWTMTSQKCIDDLNDKFDLKIFEGFMPNENEKALY
jgi:glycerophosphoryl diester phosphodiesterase